MGIGAAVDNAAETSGDLNKEAWDKYNALRSAVLTYHDTDGSHLSTGDVVLKALFDANTILAANADDTPAALTVAASRIIGRASTGSIAALTASQVNNILGTATKALDNLASVAINVSLISDTDDTDDLGSSSKEWKDLYIDGTANIDSLVADTAAISAGTITGITDLAIADGGTGSSTAANARTALGVAIGSDVQAYDAELAALAGLTSAADALPYFTGSGTATVTTLSSYMRGIIDDANEATFKASVNLEIGTDVLAYDAGLSNLAGISMAADKFYYTSGDNTHVAGTVTSFGRSIIDDADEATFKGTVNLEIGTDVLAQQTIGIANNNLMEVDDTDAASTDYARFTATGLQGRDATEAKSDLGLVIGTNVQAYDAQLADIAALAVTDGNFIVGDGANWVAESGTTALASLGLVAELDNLTSGEVGQLENIGATTISVAQWDWLGGYGVTARAKAHAGTSQSVPTGWSTQLVLDTEDYDPGSNYDNSVITGTADATQANKLHDADGGFSADDVGRSVWNTTDNTSTSVTGFVDSGELNLSADIMASGEGYKLHFSRFIAPIAGYYAFHGCVRYANLTANTGRIESRVDKNDVAIAVAESYGALGSYVCTVISDIVYLEANDYLELWTYHNSGVNQGTYTTGGMCYLTVNLICSP